MVASSDRALFSDTCASLFPKRAHARRTWAQRGFWFALVTALSLFPMQSHAVVYLYTCDEADVGFDVAQFGGVVPTCGHVDPDTGEISGSLNVVDVANLQGDTSMWGGVTFADGFNLVFYGLIFLSFAMGFSKGGQR